MPQVGHKFEGPPSGQTKRQELLAHPDTKWLATQDDADNEAVTDLVACCSPRKQSCFVLLHWHRDELLHVELFFTEAEARACFDHGQIFVLQDFGLPAAILERM